MKVRIASDGKPFKVDVKRFYIPGTTIHVECPECQTPRSFNLGFDHYLSFPQANEPWNTTLILSISVRTATPDGEDI